MIGAIPNSQSLDTIGMVIYLHCIVNMLTKKERDSNARLDVLELGSAKFSVNANEVLFYYTKIEES